jgi:hypothetical protein
MHVCVGFHFNLLCMCCYFFVDSDVAIFSWIGTESSVGTCAPCKSSGEVWFLFLLLEVWALNYHAVPFLLNSAIREKVINDRKIFSCGYCVITVKVADLIYGKNMAVFLISSRHWTNWMHMLFLIPSIIKMLTEAGFRW